MQVSHRQSPSRKVTFKKTGLDYVVSWSVIGLFLIFALIGLHLASFILIPLTLICLTLYAGIVPQTKIQPNLPD